VTLIKSFCESGANHKPSFIPRACAYSERYRSSSGGPARQFWCTKRLVQEWNEQAPAHRSAIGVGHIADKILRPNG
jgi:hypothetical protein